MAIIYEEQGLTEYAGLNFFNGDENVMDGELYDTSLNMLAWSGMSLDIGDDGNNASVNSKYCCVVVDEHTNTNLV